MTLSVKNGGTFKTVTAPSVRDGGTWKAAQGVWIKDGGVWKQAYTAVVTDPNWTSVKLLVGADGTNGSTSFTDESSVSRTLTSNGTAPNNATVSTTSPLMGTGSINLPGGSSSISAPDAADLTLTGAFTCEVLARFSSIPSQATFISHWNGGGWVFWRNGSNLQFFVSISGGNTSVVAAWTPTVGVDYHIACSRNASGKFRLRVNGVMLASGTPSTSAIDNAPGPLYIGQSGSNVGGTGFVGKLDEVRLTVGVDRYDTDSTITPPSVKFPRS